MDALPGKVENALTTIMQYLTNTERGVDSLPSEYWCNTEQAELLDTIDGLNEIIQSLDYYNFRPDLIVIDTLNRFMEGDENDTQDATRFIRNCQYLQEKYGSCVLLIHHTGVDEQSKKRARGSSAFKGNSDFQYLVQKSTNDLVILSQTKQKDGKEQKSVVFTKKEVPLGITDDEGIEINSIVLEQTNGSAEPVKKFSKYHKDLISYFVKMGYVENGKAYITAEALRACIREQVLERAEEGVEERVINTNIRSWIKRARDNVPELLIAEKNLDGTPYIYTVEINDNGRVEPVFSMQITK